MGQKDNARIFAVLTSGGDSPGMNAALRSTVRSAIFHGAEIYGVTRGYEGLIQGHFMKMSARSVGNIISRGGTILKTARSSEFRTQNGRRKAIAQLRKRGINGVVVIGGNGSFRGARLLASESGIPIIGIPGTIDNDIAGTDYTLGADTAVNTALDAIDKIRDTVHSMERIFIVEVMGRHEGFIAIRVGLTGGAEDVVIPELSHDIKAMCDDIREGRRKGKISWIVIVSEGVMPAKELADSIYNNTGFEVRHVTLGHIQRGGSPTAMDRLLGTRFGAAAVNALCDGETDKAVGIKSDEITLTPLEEACMESEKKTALDEELHRLIKMLSI